LQNGSVDIVGLIYFILCRCTVWQGGFSKLF